MTECYGEYRYRVSAGDRCIGYVFADDAYEALDVYAQSQGFENAAHMRQFQIITPGLVAVDGGDVVVTSTDGLDDE